MACFCSVCSLLYAFLCLYVHSCILAEMVSLAPSFPGDSEIDTLFKIFQALGTPSPSPSSESYWPGVDQLKDWHGTFPQWPRPSDAAMCHALHIRKEHAFDNDGIDLLRKLLEMCPARRISARQALQHPWFTKSKMANMSRTARGRLDAQAAQVAQEATVRAATRKAEKAKKKAAARAAARAAAEEDDEEGEDSNAQHRSDSEEFEEDEEPTPFLSAAATAAAVDAAAVAAGLSTTDHLMHQAEDSEGDEEDSDSANNQSSSSVSSASS